MPYIITTTMEHRPLRFGAERQTDRAVATWDQACQAVFPNFLPKSGGTITLPDETVIEVQQVTYTYLADQTDLVPNEDGIYLETNREIINAYNARQEAT